MVGCHGEQFAFTRLDDHPKATEVTARISPWSASVEAGSVGSTTRARARMAPFEIDAEENTSIEKFRMQGYFSGIYPIDN
jgi:hypothetical protein